MRFGARILGLACILALLGNVTALGEDPAKDKPGQEKPKNRYVRVVSQNKRPVALETAIVRFVPQDCGQTSPTVDLVGAIHMAEKSYYAELNRLFAKYDRVLYELVAPEGTRVPKGGARGTNNPLSAVQKGMTDLLELQFQLEGIDYTRKNLVHADMSPDEIVQSLKDNPGNVLMQLVRTMGYASAQDAADPLGVKASVTQIRFLLALRSKSRGVAMKRIFAEQFQDMDGFLEAINGPEGSTLISERNKAALKVLRKQIAAGKQNLAIFYGAGHLADFEKRLADDFGLVRLSERWLVAWDLKEQGKSAPPKPAGAGAQ